MDVRKATALLQAIAAVDESSTLAEVKAAVRDRGRLVAMLDSEGVRLARLLAAHTGCPEKAFGDAARSSQREGRRMRQTGRHGRGGSGLRRRARERRRER